eukprot:20329-Chlamydomonas_euryale.AAC.1
MPPATLIPSRCRARHSRPVPATTGCPPSSVHTPVLRSHPRPPFTPVLRSHRCPPFIPPTLFHSCMFCAQVSIIPAQKVVSISDPV